MDDLFGVEKSTILILIKEFYREVRLHFQKKFVRFPSELKCCKLARDFEVLYEISYVVGALDKPHISILALVIGGENYFY